MTSITLPPDLERRLREESQRRGTTVEVLAIDSLRQNFPVERTNDSSAKTLYDRVMDAIEPMDGPAENISGRADEIFAEYMEDKQRRGKV